MSSPPQTPTRGSARGPLIYENPLASPGDHAGFVLEGQAAISVHEGTTRLASVVDESARQAANYVWWCPQALPADFDAEWDFWPEAERGLCILFFAARAQPPYHLRLLKAGPHVAFWIDGLPILHYEDDGRTHGPVRGAGRIGFRQMAPMTGRYAGLRVHAVERPQDFRWAP